MNARSSPGAPTTKSAVSGSLPEGAIFAGRYRVVRSIAAGGMGAVYEVVHTETERRRALKVMHPHLFQSDEMRDRFKREARIAALVDSEHIVDVSDAGVDEATQTPFLVMELLQGEELGKRLKRLGRLPASEVVACLYQVALALDKTHAKSIVHRDLKPDNVFLTVREDGTSRVKILDFGVAKLVAEGATSEGATRSLGTPLYMAPEQFRIGAKLTAAADIYALGMMAYTLLVGQPYWSEEARGAGDVIAYALVVVQGPQDSAVERAARAGVTLPAAFDGWFARAAAPSPSDRFATASEAVAALHAVFTASTAAPAPGAPAATAAPASRAAPAAAQGGPQAGLSGTVMTRPASTASARAAAPETGASGTLVAPLAAALPVRKATEPLPASLVASVRATAAAPASAYSSQLQGPAAAPTAPAPAAPAATYSNQLQGPAAAPTAPAPAVPASAYSSQLPPSAAAAVAPAPAAAAVAYSSQIPGPGAAAVGAAPAPAAAAGPASPPSTMDPLAFSAAGAPASLPARGRRTSLLLPLALVGVAVVGAGIWLAVATFRGGAASGATGGDTAASSSPATAPLGTPAEPAISGAPAPSVPVSAAPGDAPAATDTPGTAPSGTPAEPTPPKPATAKPKPTSAPTTKPIKRPLLGRD